jgi:hypothetical protein
VFYTGDKKTVKKMIIFSAVLLSVTMTCIGALSDMGIMEVYKNIEAKSKVNTPNSYRVNVENEKFREALAELPEELLTGEGEPAVLVNFRKGDGVNITIENIDEEYASIFSYIEDYFKFSGISKVQNPVEFKEIIDNGKVELYKENEDSIVVKAWDPEKEEKDDNYALFYLEKRNWVITKARYFLDGNPFVEAENCYRKYGKYYMPYKIVLTSLNEESTDEFIFRDYKFNK